MDIFEILLLSFGGTTTALVVVGYFGKSLITHWFGKELEKYKLDISHENNEALETLKVNLQKSLKENDRSFDLELLMNKYRYPLIHAAYDLQSRIYNLVEHRIIEIYFINDSGDGIDKDYFINNTVFVIAQYFAWTEIIRKEIQFVEFCNNVSSKELSVLQDSIYSIWQSERYSDTFGIWAGEQRGIGELLIEKQGEHLTCIGYAKFLKLMNKKDELLLVQLESKVKAFMNSGKSDSTRLVCLQNALVDVLLFLDPDYIRFPKEYRTKIT